jgi:hypothetical protein
MRWISVMPTSLAAAPPHLDGLLRSLPFVQTFSQASAESSTSFPIVIHVALQASSPQHNRGTTMLPSVSCPSPNQKAETSHSHHDALSLLLLSNLASRDALPLPRAAVLSRPLQILQPLASFGEVLRYITERNVSKAILPSSPGSRFDLYGLDLPAALQYHRFASSMFAGTPMPTSVK